MTAQQQNLPYGLWTSPITPAMISSGIRLNDVQWAQDTDLLVWSQSYDGKTSLFAKPKDSATFDLSGELNPSGGISYGGGDFYAGRFGVVFPERNGRLYFKPYGSGLPKAITPAFGKTAAPLLTPDEKRVVFVHTYEDRDVLAVVDLDGQNWPVILAQGADFYMQPAISPDGSAIAWVEWDHPNMPWDGTRLMFALFTKDKKSLVEIHQIDGDQTAPIFQPIFSPDGNQLAYLSNRGELDQLLLFDLRSGEKTFLIKDKHLLQPAWVQGVRTLAWDPSGSALYCLDNHLGSLSLLKAHLPSGELEKIDLQDFTMLSQISISPSGEIALIASSPQKPARVITQKDGKIQVIARSQSDLVDPAFLPSPQTLNWTSSDGMQVHGFYYPPANPACKADGAPPVIVHIHGGPTSQVYNSFNLETSFFTSRGYAYFVVNYRGSTGYGRAYRDALKGNWGKLDMQDAVEGSQALVERGLADPNKLIIKGGSAGGYAVWNALIHHPGFFKAGLCSYGVSNLFLLDMDTHKFEAHYNASLIGSLPEAAQKYHDWSPVFHAHKIRDAVAVFQGSEDKVVPPNQSESMVEALKANRVPYIYRLYEGEGHGFKKAEHLVDYYESVDRFLKQHVLFSV